MICEYCGNTLPDGSTVCTYCNAKLKGGKSSQPPIESQGNSQAAVTMPVQLGPQGKAQTAGTFGAQPSTQGAVPVQAQTPAQSAGPAQMQQPPQAAAKTQGQMPPQAATQMPGRTPAQAPAPASVQASAPAPAPSPAPAQAQHNASAQVQNTPQTDSKAAPKQKKKWKLPVIIGGAAAAVIVAILVAVFAVGGASSPPPSEALEAINDASQLADDLAKRYESYRVSAEEGNGQAGVNKSNNGSVASNERAIAVEKNDGDVNDVGGEKVVGAAGESSDQKITVDEEGSASENGDDAVKAESGSSGSSVSGGATDVGSGSSAGNAGSDEAYEKDLSEINEMLSRVRADMDTLDATGKSWKGYDRALAAMKNLEAALQYELDVLEVHHNASMAGQGTGTKAVMKIIQTMQEGYEEMTPPECLEGYLEHTLNTLPTVLAALQYSAQAPNSTLSQYTTQELLSWWLTKQGAYDAESNEILVHQCEDSRDLLKELGEGKVQTKKPDVELSIIDEIAPNLYPSLDAATNIGITSYDGEHSVQVEVEVVGLSQKSEQKFDLAQGYNYLQVKPALLTANEFPNLENNSTTQINVKVTDAKSGEVLAQESHQVSLLSIYDFTWSNDEFGATAAFDIMAWLRPQSEEVNAINRAAADVLGKWTGGKEQSLAGYQYGNNALMTLAQVAAIQQAISDAGVVYVNDAYSFTSNQHVLTPDAVVKKKQGLCIETTLLMASCLMSAGMHPLIIITPTHAQIAVETYEGSGKYFLIETTLLPYEGLNTKTSDTDPAFYNGLLARTKLKSGEIHYWTTSGSSEEWQQYFEYSKANKDEFGGNFVIDCRLQPVMGIQGLENIDPTQTSG